MTNQYFCYIFPMGRKSALSVVSLSQTCNTKLQQSAHAYALVLQQQHMWLVTFVKKATPL